ncbi:MAG: SDR family NAD(P)-dependent oxidoreductase, partial [Melioribacteraceae bacterium]
IYAVIKGSAYNNDGSIKVGYTAPGVVGQRDVILSAYSMAEVALESVGYIETHGTGTSIGDPIEIDALNQTFRSETTKNKFCAIGSVKSNLGHLDTAAGIAGIIKTTLMLKHKKLVPSINFSEPNSKINFEDSPFYVNTEFKDWDTFSTRRAGVSSFGIGGTNVHVVLEEAEENESVINNNFRIIPFSAKSKNSLSNYENKFIEYLKSNSELCIDDTAYTLQTGRKEFEFRKFTVGNSADGIVENLIKNIMTFNNNGKLLENEIVFLFSGQGSQYVNMCKDLYESLPSFRIYFDICSEILLRKFNLEIKSIIFSTENNLDIASEKLKQTKYTQPSLFIVEYSLAKSLMDIGIFPNIMVGHSIGEYVAACLSGVMDLESALTLVFRRGELMQSIKHGNMLSVKISENELRTHLPNNLDLAVINSPSLCVVSGELESIIEFEKYLNEKEIGCTILHTSHAFHSRMMDDILEQFKKTLQSIELKSPQIKYMSNVTGNIITEFEATDHNYYVNHLRYTVRFSENISNLLNIPNSIFIEVGPGNVLATLTKSHQNAKNFIILNLVRSPYQNLNDVQEYLKAIGNLWLNGIKIKWDELYEKKPNKQHLPTYEFNKKRFWINYSKNESPKNKFKNNKNLDNWIYESTWKRKNTRLNKYENLASKKILVFDNNVFRITDSVLKITVKDNLKTIYIGDKYQKDFNKININAELYSDYKRLFEDLLKDNFIPDIIIHNWSSTSSQTEDNLEYPQVFGYLSLIYIGKALSENNITNKIDLNIISSNLFEVLGTENIIPIKSTILGAVNVIGQEFVNISTKLIDLNFEKEFELTNENIFLNEVFNNSIEHVVAIRNGYKWLREYESIKLISRNDNKIKLLSEKGIYLITGGFGKIGLTIAQYLAKNYKATIILIDQIEIPHKENWEKVISNSKNSDSIITKIKQLIEIEKESSELIILNCDVSDYSEVKNNIDKVYSKFGKLDGVFHAAGIVGENTIQLINQFELPNYNLQAIPKIKGSVNLVEATKNLGVKFVLFQSSLSAVLGGLGFASYSAINNFVDSYVHSISKDLSSSTKLISVNWDAWDFSENHNNQRKSGIKPNQAIEILEKILVENSPSQIIISIEDLQSSIEKFLIDKSYFIQKDISEVLTESAFHQRPEIETEYIEPETKIEKIILDEWKSLLGIEKIGINDNFFELGGNSLIGTQLVSRIRKIFNTEIPLVAVFENATIKNIAGIIEKQNTDKKDSDSKNTLNILKLVSNLSDEDTAKLLNEKS